MREICVQMSLHTVQENLPHWGCTLQRPIIWVLEQNAVKVEQLSETYSAIAERAKGKGAIIYWRGETAVAERGRWIQGPTLAGQTPVLMAPNKRYGLSMISAISNLGLVRFWFTEKAMNTDLLISFMMGLIEGGEQKIFLILDDLEVHHAQSVTVWLIETSIALKFFLVALLPEDQSERVSEQGFENPAAQQ